MMLADFINRLQQLSNDALRPYTLELDGNDPRRAYVFNPATKAIEVIPLAAAARNHVVKSLDSLAAAFGRYKSGHLPSVWVDYTQVIVILDDNNEIASDDDPNGDETRQHMLTFPVVPSPLFLTLAGLPKDQAALLNAIRHDLKPSLITPENFETAISSLRWTITDTTVGEYGTLKSTLGKDVQSEVKPGSDIPLEIAVTFEPYPALAADLQTKVTVECSVVIDPGKKLIHVRPYPGQLEAAITESVEALRAEVVERLGVDDTMVFAGTP